MNKLLHTVIAGVCLAFASFALVAEPIALNEAEMDEVTAGAIVVYLGTANAIAGGATVSNLLGFNVSKTAAIVTPGVATAAGGNVAVATSVVNPLLGIGGAAAISGAASVASVN